MNTQRRGLRATRSQQRWSWICLSVLAILVAASLGDAVQVNNRVRQAAAILLGDPRRERTPSEIKPSYSAVLQRQPIQGIRSPQGLTYNKDTQTLLTVLENKQAIAELDLCGHVIRRVQINTPYMLEEVTALSSDMVLLSFGNTNTIALLQLPTGSATVDGSSALLLDVRDEGGNRVEVEEIAWDSDGKQLFLANKEYPPRIYQTSFHPDYWKGLIRGARTLRISEWLSSKQILPFMPDITALAYSEAKRELLILSDETREIISVSTEGRVRAYLKLDKGSANLQERVRSPEGMAIAKDASIYLISDPADSYIYRFYPSVGLGQQSWCRAG